MTEFQLLDIWSKFHRKATVTHTVVHAIMKAAKLNSQHGG